MNEQPEKKKRAAGGGRKKGANQTLKSYRINNDLLAWLQATGKPNQLINKAIQLLKTSTEL